MTPGPLGQRRVNGSNRRYRGKLLAHSNVYDPMCFQMKEKTIKYAPATQGPDSQTKESGLRCQAAQSQLVSNSAIELAPPSNLSFTASRQLGVLQWSSDEIIAFQTSSGYRPLANSRGSCASVHTGLTPQASALPEHSASSRRPLLDSKRGCPELHIQGAFRIPLNQQAYT